MGKTSIEWTGWTWNPIKSRLREDTLVPTKKDPFRIVPAVKVGYYCERISGGCKNCYACAMNGRTLPAWGTGLDYAIANRDKQEIFIDEDVLAEPLHWKAPRKIFVCSMTDWAADFVTDEMMDRLLAVAAMARDHTLQFLTKRADRLAQYLSDRETRHRVAALIDETSWLGYYDSGRPRYDRQPHLAHCVRGGSVAHQTIRWPLDNCQMGFSAEDQPNFDARWEHMRKLATAGWFVWVSLEPLLGPIDATEALKVRCRECGDLQRLNRDPFCSSCDADLRPVARLQWGVPGGESGAGARPCQLEWIGKLIDQFSEAGTPLFVKQAGSMPIVGLPTGGRFLGNVALSATGNHVAGWEVKLKDRKGGEISEWPEWMRVRQFPEVRC